MIHSPRGGQGGRHIKRQRFSQPLSFFVFGSWRRELRPNQTSNFRNSLRNSLLDAFRGRPSSTKITSTGTLYFANRSLQRHRISSFETVSPSHVFTKATGTCPHYSSLLPTTPASSIAWCDKITASISAG